MTELTQDTFFEGKLKIAQMRDGYRFSIDAILLAGAIRPSPGQTLLDLGTGCGIIALLLAFRYPDISVHAVEVQQQLADLAAMNVAANRMDRRVKVICMDMNHLRCEPFDWVLCNPPYYKVFSGRINVNQQRALARHELLINLDQLMTCAKRMLKVGGRFITIYPADRLADLLERMRGSHIEPKRLQTVHSYQNEDAKMIMVHGIKGGRPGLQIAAPLTVYEADGRYTETVTRMMCP